MATTSKRVLWKGAISFGLVHIPIALHSATEEQGLDFDWLDKRSMDPVGYKRINKKTGKEIAQADIVKGLQVEGGAYVVLTPEEIQSAYPTTTHTIEIEAFVPAGDIPFLYMERPYYISPINKGAKVYALLREILLRTGKVGVAKVVIATKQHLAVLIPSGPTMVLNLLRWGDEIRTWDELELPPAGIKAAGLTDKEMKMGEQLVEDMSGAWTPEDFTDSFKEQILKLVEEKVKAGETEEVTLLEAAPSEDGGAKIYDLTEMLQRSLGVSKKSKPAANDDASGEEDEPAAKAKPKTAAKSATKTAAKTAAKSATKTAAAKPAAKKAAAKRKAA